MKKSLTGLALAATVGVSLFAASPAMAVGAYENCTAAAAAGMYNIPIGAPGYGPHLDRDGDGIGCENADIAYAGSAPEVTLNVDSGVVAETAPQIVQVPVGAPDTGVSEESDNTALFLAAGTVLAAGAALALRRKHSNA